MTSVARMIDRGGSHEIWVNPANNNQTTVPRHANRDLATGTVRGYPPRPWASAGRSSTGRKRQARGPRGRSVGGGVGSGLRGGFGGVWRYGGWMQLRGLDSRVRGNDGWAGGNDGWGERGAWSSWGRRGPPPSRGIRVGARGIRGGRGGRVGPSRGIRVGARYGGWLQSEVWIPAFAGMTGGRE